MKKCIALALVSCVLITSNASAFSLAEKDFGAFNQLIKALTFWKKEKTDKPLRVVFQPIEESVETQTRISEADTSTEKVVKEAQETQPILVEEDTTLESPEPVAQEVETVEEDVAVEEEKEEQTPVPVSEPVDQEKPKKVKKEKIKKLTMIASADAQGLQPTKPAVVETEIPAVEPLPQEEAETVSDQPKVNTKPVFEPRKSAVKRKTITFKSPKPTVEKREPIVYDRYLDFEIPERVIQRVFDTKHREDTGTVTGQILSQLNHRVKNADLKAQGISELVGVGVSNFSGSDKNRLHNIHNAITKFDGRIIKQGEEFSFNEILENAGPSNGFVLSKVIINGMTKYGWGGGVCQLSTTLFRSAYNSGLPITARRNHTFKVPYYTPQGFDATIYLGGQDFKFLNTTPGDVMIQIVTRGEEMAVLLYGTRDRKTEVVGPFQNGMAYTWKRTITKDGEASEEKLASYYRPEVKPVAVAE